ncbi:MAG: hypothetical protein ACXADL_12345 [Candidatus Thorarchaeota archaeon]|jgi:hypothetical protein
MTVKMESACMSFRNETTTCGRSSCIILYNGDGCILCDAAYEILNSAVVDFALSPDVISIVDIKATYGNSNDPPSPMGLPAIRICEEVITGLPQIDEAKSAIMHAVLKGCFSL